MQDALILRDMAREQLIQIKDVESGVEYLSKVKAIETWARAEKKDAELQMMIAEQKIRTQRILGQLIQEGQSRGEVANQNSGNRNLEFHKETLNEGPKTLSQIGLTKKDSHVFKQIASIPEETFEAAISEKKNAVNKAVNELTTSGMLELAKRETTKSNREERIDKINQGNVDLTGNKKYAVIYADPPWKYEHTEADNRSIENHYPTMELQDICNLKVSDLSTDDAILFMWTTAPKVEEAIKVINAWGFSYRTCAIWDKQKIGMGYYFRIQHELLFVATKGSIPTPLPENRPSSVISSPRREHSQKPELFYEIINRFYPELPKIELFCRSPQPGWDVWGNQSNA